MQFEPITSDGCGVIATIIPVLLLAGLFDTPLLHLGSWRAPRESELPSKEIQRRKQRRARLLIALSLAAALVLGGLGMACVGAAAGGFDRTEQTEMGMVWTSLVMSAAFLVITVIVRVLNVISLEATEGARENGVLQNSGSTLAFQNAVTAQGEAILLQLELITLNSRSPQDPQDEGSAQGSILPVVDLSPPTATPSAGSTT